MGARFAFTGGREGWVRLTLTAVGVGLGVALLLLTTALPSVLTQRHQREQDRQEGHMFSMVLPPKADDTVLITSTDTRWHAKDVRGRLLEPEGPRAPLPPGVGRFPGKGEMVVSPRCGTCSPRTGRSCCGSGSRTGSPGPSGRAG